MNEHDLIADMEKDFKKQHMGSFWRKIHGSKFQAGFPDVVAALPDVATLCEFKWCDTDRLLMGPFAYLVTEMLTGLQFAELTMLGALSETCPMRARVLVGCPITDDDSGKEYVMALGCDVADLPRYRGFSAVNVAALLLAAKETGKWNYDPAFFPDGHPRGLEFQLRATPSNEQWRVGQLVLGMRRYKVFDIREKHDPEMHEMMYGDERDA